MSADVSSMQSRLLALAALSMGFSLISSAFGFYYVKVFLNYFHIQESWFQFAQVCVKHMNTDLPDIACCDNGDRFSIRPAVSLSFRPFTRLSTFALAQTFESIFF